MENLDAEPLGGKTTMAASNVASPPYGPDEDDRFLNLALIVAVSPAKGSEGTSQTSSDSASKSAAYPFPKLNTATKMKAVRTVPTINNAGVTRLLITELSTFTELVKFATVMLANLI